MSVSVSAVSAPAHLSTVPATRPRSRRDAAPTPFTLSDLQQMTRRIALDVRVGRHRVVIDPARRWFELLYSDGLVDVWLISWATEQAAELHDHAGSLGALTVVAGTLTERRWTGPAGLRQRTLHTGRGAAFPLGHVHDVTKAADEAAVSVHAYAPPLSAMSYYDVQAVPGFRGQQRLRRARTELVEPGQGVG